MTRAITISIVCLLLVCASCCQAEDRPPAIRLDKAAGQLLVQGKPFLMLGGELGNSSAGTAAQADAILPEMAGFHDFENTSLAAAIAFTAVGQPE